MRWITGGTVNRQAMNGRPRRQLRKLALIGTFLLSACGGSEPSQENLANPSGVAANRAPLSAILRGGVKFAAVSADESRAAEVGRDILLAGGNATDAAVAMYFAMAVTLPSAASLGASGVCIVHNAQTRAGEAFTFGPVAAPGGIRGVSDHGAERRACDHADACPPWPGALGGHRCSRRTARAARRSGVARLGARPAGGSGVARRRQRSAPHLRQGQRHRGDRRR